MTLQQKIDTAIAYKGISKTELSKRLGYKSPQAFQKRYTTGKFTLEELEEIANVLGCKYQANFIFEDGTTF